MSSPPAAPPAEVLLGRPEFATDLAQAAEFVRDRRVLITGAAGSVGTPLAQVLAAAGPASLVLVDHHEHSLFSLERALGAARAGPSFQTELADIREPERMKRVFDRHAPQIVVHLAAAKHVPYGERFPEGAVAANVLATSALLDLSREAGVGTFIYPSSDKSVRPPSVYGATKRIAEALVQLHSQRDGARGPDGRWAIVRYVNIVGTRGSVVETFTQQVLLDRPLSVTDERMTRYWISMDEAVWSALLAAQCAAPGEVVMPACGEPVPLLETARRLAGWYRPERVPYPITCTGIRPGERLHEVLLSANESFAEVSSPSPGPLPGQGLRSVRTTRDPARLAELPRIVDDLRRQVEAGDRDHLAATCLAAAEALQ